MSRQTWKACIEKSPTQTICCLQKKNCFMSKQCQPFMDVSCDKSDPKIEVNNDVTQGFFLFFNLKALLTLAAWNAHIFCGTLCFLNVERGSYTFIVIYSD